MLVGQKLGLKVETDHSGTFADLMCINVGADFIFPPWCALHYLLFTLHFVDIAKMHNILKYVKMIICALQKARQPGTLLRQYGDGEHRFFVRTIM